MNICKRCGGNDFNSSNKCRPCKKEYNAKYHADRIAKRIAAGLQTEHVPGAVKWCSQCETEKPTPMFNRHIGAKDGYSHACKQCQAISDAAYREKHKDRQLAQKRLNYALNPELYKQRVARWQKANPEICNALNAVNYARRRKAIPKWANEDSMSKFYKVARLSFELTGIPHEVDHIVPIHSHLVCGLHCEANLRVISMSENASKSNRYWPDMP